MEVPKAAPVAEELILALDNEIKAWAQGQDGVTENQQCYRICIALVALARSYATLGLGEDKGIEWLQKAVVAKRKLN